MSVCPAPFKKVLETGAGDKHFWSSGNWNWLKESDDEPLELLSLAPIHI